ncbi:MAG TPA: hypothetical protein VFT22_16095 [Kofleriaceae bacterium]|nr:hypothetical protein [Kofleriaceae bacterium]
MRDDRDDRDEPDGSLSGIDLTAWQPPAPPPELAARVIARMREPAPAAAVEPQERRPRRWGWAAGATASVAIAAVVVVGRTWGLTHGPAPDADAHGELVSVRPQQLALGGSIADLDPGAELRWVLEGHRISVHQVRGTVRWTVADEDTLVIDTGGPAPTRTLEASGASLRVEVSMNLSDVRLVGLTTASAAAVALVTAVVYQGHVRATSGGQTVNVAPGATVKLVPQRPPQLPAEPVEPADQRPDRPPVAVGASPDELQQLRDRLQAADAELARLRAEVAARTAQGPGRPITIEPAALDAARVGGDRNIVPDDDTRRAIDRAGAGKIVGSFKLCIDTTGAIASVTMQTSTGFDAYDRKIERGMRSWTYRPFLVDGKPAPVCSEVSFVYMSDAAERRTSSRPPRPPPTASPPDCGTFNVEDAMAQAQNQYAAGFAKAALSLVMKALTCKQDVKMYRLAALYACAAHDAATARQVLGKVPVPLRAPILQRCQQEGIDLSSADVP